jgi:hypothetical protein
MSETNISITPGSGATVDTFTPNGSTAQRQAVVIADPVTAANAAGVNSAGQQLVQGQDAPSQIGLENIYEALARTNQLLTAIAFYLKELPAQSSLGVAFADEPNAFRDDPGLYQ